MRLKQLLHMISRSSMSLTAGAPAAKVGRACFCAAACGCTLSLPKLLALAVRRAKALGSFFASRAR